MSENTYKIAGLPFEEYDIYTTNTSDEQTTENLRKLIFKIEEIKEKLSLTTFAHE